MEYWCLLRCKAIARFLFLCILKISEIESTSQGVTKLDPCSSFYEKNCQVILYSPSFFFCTFQNIYTFIRINNVQLCCLIVYFKVKFVMTLLLFMRYEHILETFLIFALCIKWNFVLQNKLQFIPASIYVCFHALYQNLGPSPFPECDWDLLNKLFHVI